MSRALYLLDPGPSPAWQPFARSRPVAELRAGARLVREWWEAYAGAATTAVFSAPHLSPFPEAGAAPVMPRGPVLGPALVGCSDFLPFGSAPDPVARAAVLIHRGRRIGWLVPESGRWEGPDDVATGATFDVDGLLLQGAFDLVTALESLLRAELEARIATRGEPVPRATTVLGDPGRVGIYGAAVEPGVVFDVRGGPVVLEAGVQVRSDTRLEGPLWVGPHSRVVGGPIRSSAVGPRCVVRGEMAFTVMVGYANKAHDGFVGHSVIGCWANLGAGTITSNLKNTYGHVDLDVGGVRITTGRQFLGALIGDHVKTAIGTLLSTGTVIGCGANVFGAVRPPKYVPPFAWGGGAEDGERMRRDGFLTIAERVLPRREVPVDDAVRDFLGRVYDTST